MAGGIGKHGADRIRYNAQYHSQFNIILAVQRL
jgi:hypothetical protein